MATVTIRKWNGDDLAEGETQEGEEWQETAARLYNKAIGARGGRRRHVALVTSFPGGGTKHVQFGYNIGRSQQTTLDSTVIVRVDE